MAPTPAASSSNMKEAFARKNPGVLKGCTASAAFVGGGSRLLLGACADCELAGEATGTGVSLASLGAGSWETEAGFSAFRGGSMARDTVAVDSGLETGVDSRTVCDGIDADGAGCA